MKKSLTRLAPVHGEEDVAVDDFRLVINPRLRRVEIHDVDDFGYPEAAATVRPGVDVI